MAGKIRRDVDNALNSINKQLNRFASTFGVSSQVYQSLATAAQGIFGKFGTKILKRAAGKINFKRSAFANNLTDEIMNFSSIMSKFNFTEIKADMMNQVREWRKARGMNSKQVRARVTYAEIKMISESVAQLSIDFDEALDYLYAYHQDAQEFEAAMNIVRRPGKRTYGELSHVVDLAKQLHDRIELEAKKNNITNPDVKLNFIDNNTYAKYSWLRAIQNTR